MAKLSAVIIPHHIKSDGSCAVKIRISQKSQKAYIDTRIIAKKKDISGNKLKQDFIIKNVSPLLTKYDGLISDDMHQTADVHTIKKRITSSRDKIKSSEHIDFISYCSDYVDGLVKSNKKNSSLPLRTVVNSLTDFYKGDFLCPKEITSKFLKDYEVFLRAPRKITRINQFGKKITTRSKGLSDSGLFKHMANLRLLFNACKVHYNDYDYGDIIIDNNPFIRYKIKPVRSNKKRSLSLEELISVFCQEATSEREIISKDMFFLSFFMCGMNSVDIYNYNDKLEVIDGRLGYNRSKTKDKRADKAYISLSVPDCAKVIIDKYRGKLKKRYSDDRTFCSALNKGLKSICDGLDFTCTFYFARHTFATIARNECRFSKDDIAEALNHVDSSLRVTDDYITKDWKIIDDVQSAVLKFFFDKVNELGQPALDTQ